MGILTDNMKRLVDDGARTEADMLEAHRARFARLHERRYGPG
jgi:hypothetical protein